LAVDKAIRTGRDPNSPSVQSCASLRPYGSHPAQLGNMREGDVDAVVDCAISSPPYSGSRIEPGNVGNEMMRERWNKGRLDNPDKVGYGSADGQLAAMPTGDVADACISSPPWEESTPTRGDPNYAHKFHGDQSKYGDTTGNIGNATGDTFWQAARTITEQVYQVLKPGGVAIWVLKAFVRNKAIVDFPGQWQRMAESCGFETVEIIHAMLTEDRGAQYALDGELHEKTVKRVSFFRRLHEFQASAKMHWEQHVTDRSARAGYIRGAHRRLWESYRADVAEGKEDPEGPPARVTRNRILTEARTSAYEDAGKPWMDIDTRIDFEVVLCQQKPE